MVLKAARRAGEAVLCGRIPKGVLGRGDEGKSSQPEGHERATAGEEAEDALHRRDAGAGIDDVQGIRYVGHDQLNGIVSINVSRGHGTDGTRRGRDNGNSYPPSRF